MAIDTGLQPTLFLPEELPWPLLLFSSLKISSNPIISSPKPLEDGMERLPSMLTSELADIWVAMSNFCTLVNTASEKNGAKITEEMFLHSMGSIMYRLLYQRFEIGSIGEAFRLGLLAFASPIFLHWNRVELSDYRFTSRYKDGVVALNLGDCGVTPEEHLWLLMVAALSMSHESDGLSWLRPRLRETITLCNISTWDAARDLLSSFMWVGLIYDVPGREVFDLVMSQQPCNKGIRADRKASQVVAMRMSSWSGSAGNV